MFGFSKDIYQPKVAAAVENFIYGPHSYSDDVAADSRGPHGSFLKKAHEDKTFKIILNMCHFVPEEVIVKKVDDNLVVSAKHVLKPDEHGYVSREFTRRFKIPDDVDRDNIKPVFNRNGLLIITAQRNTPETPSDPGVIIPLILQKPVQPNQEEDAVLEQDEVSPTGTQYVVREVL